jgi:4-amino-4-deoxy-L-arabinose transferase-like glycosyltransferase
MGASQGTGHEGSVANKTQQELDTQAQGTTLDKPIPDQVQQRKIATALLLLVAILGVILILYISRFGLGTTGDSVRYLMGAENILAGEGFGRTAADGEVRPITMFAPFFSTAISGLGLIGSIFDGARFLQALLFGASIFLVGHLIYRHTLSLWASLTGAVIILVSESVVLFHAWLMPEALYIFLMLLSIYLLTLYLENSRTYLLILMAIVAGLATLTRYVGISLIALAYVSILLMSGTNWKIRLREIVMISVFGLGPVALWIARNVVVAGDIVNRVLSYHPVSVELIRAYRAEISFWFVPEQLGLRHVVRQIIMIFLAFVAPVTYFSLELRDGFLKKGIRRDPSRYLVWILIIYAAIYVVTFVLNLTFLDALLDFNTVPRYLTPLYVICVAIFVIVFHGLALRAQKWWAPRVVIAAIGISLIVLYAQNTLPILLDPTPSLGYTGIKMERTDIVERLESINRAAPIISNDPELVYILADRAAYMLPIRYDANIGKEREDFDLQIEATRRKLNDGGMLVLFSPINDSVTEVINLLEVELIDSFYGSSFYAYAQVINE